MNDTYVTLQGWVGSDVTVRDVKDTQCASFRVGCTPRFYRNGEWSSGETQWYTVQCWRTLGLNVVDSVRVGDAVVVHGRVRLDVWEKEGSGKSVTWLVDATFVGHDMSKGTSSFVKTQRSAGADLNQDAGVKEMLHAYGVDGPQLNDDGEVVEPAA